MKVIVYRKYGSPDVLSLEDVDKPTHVEGSSVDAGMGDDARVDHAHASSPDPSAGVGLSTRTLKLHPLSSVNSTRPLGKWRTPIHRKLSGGCNRFVMLRIQ
jgi:hypothetical protein